MSVVRPLMQLLDTSAWMLTHVIVLVLVLVLVFERRFLPPVSLQDLDTYVFNVIPGTWSFFIGAKGL